MAYTLLCLLALTVDVFANPLPTPPPVKSTSEPAGTLGSLTCTTVLTSTINGFQGDFTSEIAKTIYTKTVTEYSRVPCNGCALSITTQRASFWGGHGPQQIITATITARHATTTTATACDHHPTLPPTHGQIPRADTPPNGQCTYTQVVIPSPHAVKEGDKTVYTATATTTSHIDCKGCNFLAVSTLNPLHPGPMVQYTSTVTASSAAIETAYVCLKSPSVVLPPSSSSPLSPIPLPTTSPSAVPTAVATVTKTVTHTIYAGTVTVIRTSTCGLSLMPSSSQGAIPQQEERDTERRKTETIYDTKTVSTSASWTRTSFHCIGRPTVTPTPIPGAEEIVQDRGVHQTTRPPPIPTPPNTSIVTTITVNYPGEKAGA